MTAYIRDLFAYFKENETSTLPVRFDPPPQEHMVLTDKLIEELSDLDAKIAPIAPCFEDGDDWLGYYGVTRSLDAGLGYVMPFQTIEVKHERDDEPVQGAPLLVVKYLLVPNGSVYEFDNSSPDGESLYRYFAGFDIQFELTFQPAKGGAGFSCEFTVSPPDQFTTSHYSTLSRTKYVANIVYRKMIQTAFKDLPYKILESVLQMEIDNELKEKMFIYGIDDGLSTLTE